MAQNLLNMIKQQNVFAKMDNREILWRVFDRFIDEGELDFFGPDSDLLSELENRLYPEYDGETVAKTAKGWSTPEGEINYK